MLQRVARDRPARGRYHSDPMTSSGGPFASALIDATRRAWAASTSARVRERGARVTQGLERAGVRDLALHFEGLLEYLSVALQFEAPELFLDHVGWMATAFRTRGVATETLVECLEALERELESRLPVHAFRPVAVVLARAREVAAEPAREEPSTLQGDGAALELARAYLLAALEGRRREALQLVLDAARGGMELGTLQHEVIGRVQAELGRLWHEGELSVVEEHLVSRTSEQVLAALALQMPRTPRLGRRVLVTGANGDLHDLGLRVLVDRFDLAGFDPVFLGASTPADEAARAAADFEIDLVLLGAKLAIHLRGAAAMIERLRAQPTTATLPVIVGGRPFELVPGLAQRIGASGYARDAGEALALARRLTGTA